MKKSKTIETIDKFYSFAGSTNPTSEEREFIYSFELELAKSLIQEFGEKSTQKLSKILFVATE